MTSLTGRNMKASPWHGRRLARCLYGADRDRAGNCGESRPGLSESRHDLAEARDVADERD